MRESDIIEFCEDLPTEKLEQLVDHIFNVLFNRRRSEEMLKRLNSGETRKCLSCEYGKFGPCKFKHWNFPIDHDDTACSDFQEWGLVF